MRSPTTRVSAFETLEGRRLLSRGVEAAATAPLGEAKVETALPRYLTDAEKAVLATNPWSVTTRLPSAPPKGPIDSVAEYEAMEGLVISWAGSSSWLTILAQIAKRVTVEGNGRMYIGVPNASTQTSATNTLTAQGANLANVTFFTVAIDSIWARDYGPRYVFEGDVRVIADHKYNRPRANDDNEPITFAALKKQQYYEMGINGTTLIHGGGNYHLAADGDAYATSLITDENPSLTAAQVKAVWQTYQGNNTTITGEFPLSVDATGHIDMWMQIYADKKVFISDWPNASGSTQDQICDTTAALMQSRGYQVTRLPAYLSGGTHYTFANMVIFNNVVLLPQYNNGPGATISAQTLATVQAAFGASKTVYAINADAIVTAAGVFHCIVQHVPKARGAAGVNGGLAPTAYLSGLTAGQSVQAGDLVNVKWITDDDAPVAATGGVQSVDLQLSTDGGLTYPTTIATGRPALGTYTWTVPAGIDTNAARIRVVARDGVNNTGSDALDANFTIGTPVALPVPIAPDLVAASDTGDSANDHVTRFNNASAETRLSFNIAGLSVGATVKLFADGALVGQTLVTDPQMTVTTDGITTLADNTRIFTATQAQVGRPDSAASQAAAIVIDATRPALLGAVFAFEMREEVLFTASESAELSGLRLIDRQTGQEAAGVTLLAENLAGGNDVSVRPIAGDFPDGDWRVVADAHDVAGNTAVTPFAAEFFALAGDLNRDRSVGFADLVILAQNYGLDGRFFSQGNANHDAAGVVDFADLVLLAQTYGNALPAVAQIAPSAGDGPRRDRVAAAILA